tara:strand:- start:1165 stop:1434 length:270 start_codon:yes stop_codon:yes gene_type:complete
MSMAQSPLDGENINSATTCAESATWSPRQPIDFHITHGGFGVTRVKHLDTDNDTLSLVARGTNLNQVTDLHLQPLAYRNEWFLLSLPAT